MLDKSRRFPAVAIWIVAPLWIAANVQSSSAQPPTDHRDLKYFTNDCGRAQTIETADDWARRREQILIGMQAAMGPLPPRDRLPPLDLRVLDESRQTGYIRRSVTFCAEDGDRIPALLLLPENRAGRAPAMLALHPTARLGKRVVMGEAEQPNRAYGAELARRGYVVLCPDYPSFGDYKYDFAADRYHSGTMKGIFNHMRCVDLLASLDEVDADRIGVIGHSLGGHNAMFVGALDQRLKVIVSSCGWTPFHHYYGGKLDGWTSDRYMPRIRDTYRLDPDRVPFDFAEVVAALAPRAFFSSSPLRDDNFSVDGVKGAAAAAQEVYRLLGAVDQLQVRYPECGHDFPEVIREEAYVFIDKVLAHAPAKQDLQSELPRIPPKQPDEALETFQLIEGFQLEQVAAEPLVRDPVALSFDERGRMYVVEMCDYSEQSNDFLGTVRLLEDSDDDGRFDKSTLFAAGLSWPTAVICYDGGVFIGAAPDIIYCKDTDGDGKSDIRQTVFTGFGRSNVQGLLNSLTWGLDNRVHGATSSSGGKVRRPDQPESTAIDLRGRDFSFDPRTLDMRPESGGAQHGLSFDDWGRKFVCSNSDHIQLVMCEERYLARNPNLAVPSSRESIAADGPQAEVYRTSPVEPWRIVRTRLRISGEAPGVVEGGGRAAGYFTGATGVTIYRGDAWPREFQGQAFIGDVGGNLVHRKSLKANGVGLKAYRADEGREFLSSSDIWFRPAQFANAPDGTLYVLDVYREVIEHPASLPPQIKQHLDLTSGRDRGRIYRIVPVGKQLRTGPLLNDLGTDDLVELLEHPNGWQRDMASRLLYEQNDPPSVPALASLAAQSKLPQARLHALYALRALDSLTAEQILRALDDPHPRVREHAVRLSETVLDDSSVRAALFGLTDDADDRVRYQLAFTLGEMNDAGRQKPLVELFIRDGAKKWPRIALLSSLGGDSHAVLKGLLAHEPLQSELILELTEQFSATATADDHCVITELMADLPEGAVRPLLIGLEQGLQRKKLKLTDLLSEDAASLEFLRRVVDQHRRLALSDAAVETREAAIEILQLATLEDISPALSDLLKPQQPQAVQIAAFEVLLRFPDKRVAEMILAAWPSLSPALRSAALDALPSRVDWMEVLVTAIEDGCIKATDLDAARIRQLATSGSAAIRPLAQKIADRLQINSRQEVLDAYRGVLDLRGDIDRGRLVFRANCSSCHRLEDIGHEIGPSLGTVASRGAEAILLNVLDPNREVNPQYVTYVVLTMDGRSTTGMIAAESAGSITLRRAENVTESLLRLDIEEIRGSGMSLMPEGLEKQIEPAAMADLIAYLLSAGQLPVEGKP